MSDVEIFQCPGCKEYIASDAASCRFCKRPLDAQAVQAAVAATHKENRKYRRGHYLNHMLIGLGLFAVGLLIFVAILGSDFTRATGRLYMVACVLIIAGGGDFLYGMVGVLGELFSRK